ncbi:MAG: hypothetical protein DRP26_02540 [Candidatus Zixiibacteriota bacterium]|nr:MAG: hypothetical protein DRP26_02540 [candidate division Zixibacteria bacterium]
MRKKIFLVLLIASVLPFIGVTTVLHFVTVEQQQDLAQKRLSMVISGVVSSYDRTAAGILAQVRTLASNDELTRTLLLTDEIGFIDQPALIKSTVNYMNLLNLDYLIVTGPHGKVLAQGHEPIMFGFSIAEEPIINEALLGQQVHSLGIREIEGKPKMMMMAVAPVWFKDRVIGVVAGGVIIDEAYLEDLKGLAGAELILVRDDVIEASTIPGKAEEIKLKIKGGDIYTTELRDIPYNFCLFPLVDFTDEKIANLLIGVSTYDLKTAFNKASLIFILFAGGGFILAFVLAWGFAHKISKPITMLAGVASRMATGDFEVDVKTNRSDEIGQLIASFNSMAADLKEYHQKLIDSERMTAFTQMAQKVAHEIKNPLTPIQVSIQDLRRSYNNNDKDFPEILKKSCNTVLEEVSTLLKIVREFSEFARFPKPQFDREDLNELVDSLASLYSADKQANRLVIHLSDRKLSVDVDRDQIKRAVHNVLKNALEATGQTGKVELTTYEENSFAVIQITDNGPGFSPQAKKNLFSPYFTTKPKGSGLGLVIAKKIITEHNGTIHIDDNANGGTVVKIKLRIAG